ncbi:MAG: response regulator [Acidobacteria bacterium]|nr:MAG: response regulator [Acidobacteriota bacterium]REK04020.1 MAG: response regulator [Acidobacteriota bacterium]REK15182.1 MAG: response regulator [Acidobacteriota bacterium]REK46272.1 MAG: response regulator [Acidobacteriota bacterium]
MFRALIVDDEPPAREIIRKMLAEDAEIEIAGECSNGAEAIEAIAELKPDLMFLDIQMPEVDGFELLEACDGEKMPAVIFVTAFNRYAVKAFEVSAVDYLLKPFDHARMALALERAKTDLKEKSNAERSDQVLDLLNRISEGPDRLKRFVIKNNGRILLVPAEDVDWIESDGNYLLLHSGDDKHLIRETLKSMEERLDPELFFRIHRSTIVNIDSVKELQKHFNDEHVVLMKSGKELILSRRYRGKLSEKLGASI